MLSTRRWSGRLLLAVPLASAANASYAAPSAPAA